MAEVIGRRRARRRNRPRPRDNGAQMPLVEHLRERRARLLKSLAAIAVGAVVGLVYYQPIFDFLVDPIRAQLDTRDQDVRLIASGIVQPFTFQLKIAGLTGLLVASPVWLYQMWAFVLPGLYRRERRYTYLFFATAVPLFLGGVSVAYWLLPKTYAILLGFTPADLSNYIPIDEYLSFLIRFLVVFGLAFELPVVVVLLNLVGVVSSGRLRSWWRPIIFLIFVFAAVATPTPDPFSMLVLALPIVALFGLSLLITTLLDRRRRAASSEPDYGSLNDDVASPLDSPGHAEGER